MRPETRCDVCTYGDFLESATCVAGGRGGKGGGGEERGGGGEKKGGGGEEGDGEWGKVRGHVSERAPAREASACA